MNPFSPDAISKLLLQTQAISLNPQHPYTFVSGIKSPIYCDNRLILSYPEKRDIIVEAYLVLIREKRLVFDVVAGVATSGIPWAALIADRLQKPMIYVRGEAKQHGKGNLIEGRLEQGSGVLLIEDLISTGKSSLAVVAALREAGAHVAACVAIFTYNFKIAAVQFDAANCVLHTLSNFENLVQIASEEGYLEHEDVQHVLAWNKDPENWGGKQ